MALPGNAAIPAAEVDMLILATTTPDNTFPATATKVQDKLGMVNGAAFDIQAVCSGFIYGMAIADNFTLAGCIFCLLTPQNGTSNGSCGPGALIIGQFVADGRAD